MNTRVERQVLLTTKLHQPRVTADLVRRPRLKKALNAGLDRPLLLVAAPAGFGKSTLLSAWLETSDLAHAWISLDEADNDLGVFLAYFVEAIQTLFPNALTETQAFLTGISLPNVSVIAKSLINELDEKEREFILVLDDYHLIREQSIHELLSLLLQYPPQGMHLVIATRQDPPLPLGAMRASNQIVEFRGQDLRFSRDEIAAFVERSIGLRLNDDALDMLTDKTEGWAVGLRLAALAFRGGGEVDRHLVELAENRYLIDYMMREVLAHVPPAMMSFLLKTSILDQMCNSLCMDVIGPDDPECNLQENLVWLEKAHMFVIALDSRDEWYRYHHLFQELLRDQLTRQVDADEIANLHIRASAWFARQGSLEQALHHALLGHDTRTAVHLLAEHRQSLMNSERWQLLERIFNMFPADAIAHHPELMLLAIQIALLRQYNQAVFLEMIERAESHIAQMQDQSEHAAHLQGEIDTMRAIMACESASDLENAIALAKRALTTMPRTWYYLRAVAWLWLAVAYQMTGRLDLAYAALAEGQPEDVSEDGAVHVRVALSRGFIKWMAGDIPAIPQETHHLLAVADAHQRRDSQGWAHYLLSSVAYEHNDLTTAETHNKVLEQMRYVGRPMAYLQSAFIAASIEQARGLADEAQGKLQQASDFLRETRSEKLDLLVQGFRAELDVRQGDLGAAGHWATTIGPFLPLTLMPYFYAPQLTMPKILLAQNTPSSRDQAAEALSRLHAFATAKHNTRFTIEVLALQALFHDGNGDEQAALALLAQSVLLAEPGGFIRLFVDLGPRMARLLARLRQTGVAPVYMGQILQAFGERTPVAPVYKAADSSMEQPVLMEPLTEREREILALLAQRLTNKEIAERLVISPMTVKRHATNIYGKLQVRGRREAVAKAVNLGLL